MIAPVLANHIELNGLAIEIVRKNIKNIYLRVYPPIGAVRISAPKRMSMEMIRQFLFAKLGWIEEQQRLIRERPPVVVSAPVDPTHHYLWGKRYELRVVERTGRSKVELHEDAIVLHVRSNATVAAKRTMINAWYRQHLEQSIPPLLQKWESVMGVRSSHVSLRQMKTRWGSCSPGSRRIRLNIELAKKSPDCLEYVVVHELVHLLEPSHNHRFVAFMDKYLADWRRRKDELNRPMV